MSEKSGKADKHVWTPVESELLVQCMLLMNEKGELMSDGGLKTGALGQLKNMLHDLIPGCTLKAYPNIQSRYKKLKTDYGVVSDLLNKSGFGWDNDRKCVTAPNTVWDELARVT